MTDTWTTVELVHREILETAAQIANVRAGKEGIDPPTGRVPVGTRFSPNRKRTGFVVGEIFRPDPIRSQKGGLCLSLEPSVVNGASQERIDYLHAIGRQAIREAIIAKKERFAGVILGEARAGRNYFGRYEGR